MRLQTWIFVTCLSLLFSVSVQPFAEAEKFKRVPASKYTERAPLKNYIFKSETGVHLMGRRDAFANTLEHLKAVSYAYEDPNTAHKYPRVWGVLDTSKPKAKWILKPHYNLVTRLTDNMLVARTRDPETGKTRVCIVSILGGDCRPTEMESFRTVRHGVELPDEMSRIYLYRNSDRENIFELELFHKDGRKLTTLTDVPFGRDRDGIRFLQIDKFDDGVLVRVRSESDEFSDRAYLPNPDGSYSITEFPPFSFFENGEEKRRMFTADVSLGLVWPVYEIEGGYREAPFDLLGIKPLAYDYGGLANEKASLGRGTASIYYCCNSPSGWAVAWETEDGLRYAVIPTPEVPSFENVLASRVDAHYEDVRPLWKFGASNHESIREEDKRRGVLVHYYLMARDTDISEVYTAYWPGTKLQRSSYFEHITSLPDNQLEDWLRQRSATQAETRQAAFQQYKEQEAAAFEARQAYWARVRAQRAEARQQRYTVRSSSAEDAARLERIRETERREAAALAESYVPTAEERSRQFWSNWRNNPTSTSPARPRPRIDYWRSYDRSNTSGQYITSSGAETGCRLGTGSC